MRIHCCDRMDITLADKTIKITYSKIFRQYYIKYKDNSASKAIYYCPWCGNEFPDPLIKEWADELEKMGFNDPLDENIPDEFKSDAWWKSRKYNANSGEN